MKFAFGKQNPTCDLCGREVFGGERICAACMSVLPFVEKRCPICGRSVLEEGICLECKGSLPVFDMARSVFRHEKGASKLVVRYKRGGKYLMIALSDFLFPLMKEFPEADSLSYVPMTAKAERRRGYNQSRLLAERLSQLSGLPVYGFLEKIKETSSQKFLGKKERGENLKDCFRVREKKEVAGRKILLIDDTMTTGATLNALSAALKQAGAQKVYALTVTGVPNRNPSC